MQRYPASKKSPDPAWIARIRGQLEKSLSPGAFKRAEKIIEHPKAIEAYDLLAREYRSVKKDYPHFAELIEICAISSQDPLFLPGVYKDRSEQRLMAKYAGQLVGPVKALSGLGGGQYFRSAIFALARHQAMGGRTVDGRTPEGKRVFRDAEETGHREAGGVPSDAQIIMGIEAVAKVLTTFAAMPRKRGRRENLAEYNVIVGLDHALRRHFNGEYPPKAIPLLLRATFARIITADNVRKVLKKPL